MASEGHVAGWVIGGPSHLNAEVMAPMVAAPRAATLAMVVVLAIGAAIVLAAATFVAFSPTRPQICEFRAPALEAIGKRRLTIDRTTWIGRKIKEQPIVLA